MLSPYKGWNRMIYDELGDSLTSDRHENWSLCVSNLHQAVIIETNDYHPKPLIISKNQLVKILALLCSEDRERSSP